MSANTSQGKQTFMSKIVKSNSQPSTSASCPGATLNTRIVISLVVIAILALVLIVRHIRRIEHPSVLPAQIVTVVPISVKTMVLRLAVRAIPVFGQ